MGSAPIAHRIGSPLSALLEYPSFCPMERSEISTRSRRMVIDRAREAVGHLAERIEEMVDGVRAESGISIEIKLAEIEIRPILQDLQEWAIPRLRGKAQRLSVQLTPHAPTICSDAGRLAQALRHLIENANRYTPAGGRIEIGVAFDPGATGFARITIADDGPGMPEEQRERLFEPFSPRPSPCG